MPRRETLADRIRRLMEEKGLNQASLSDKSGVPRSELNRALNDHRQFRAEELAWLSTALGTDVDALLKNVEIPPDVLSQAEKAQAVAARLFELEAKHKAAVDEAKALSKEVINLSVNVQQLTTARDEERAQRIKVQESLNKAQEEIESLRRALKDEQNLRLNEHRKLKQSELRVSVLQNQQATLTEQVRKLSGGQLGVGAWSALGGLVLGGIIGAAAKGSQDDDDEYEEEDDEYEEDDEDEEDGR